MPRLTKFQDDWLELTDNDGNKISLWCTRADDDFHCFCRFCRKVVVIGNSGKVQILQHANTAKHKKCTKNATDASQIKFTSITTASGQRGLGFNTNASSSYTGVQWNLNAEEKIIRSEILWTLNVAVHNLSFSSCDGIGELFSKMFPECSEAKGMKLSSRKISYEISHGLGPYFLSKLSTAVQNCSFFTLMYDETLNESNKKQIDFHVRFWNNTLNQIQQSYVGSKILYHAAAINIDSSIMSCIEDSKFPLKKLLMLGSDGPNVNKSVSTIMNKRLEGIIGKGLVNIGTCNLHIVHNAFGDGLKIEAFSIIVEFLEDVNIWFRKYPSRQEDLMLAAEEGDDICNPLRYVSNRWLSIVPVCTRILKIYAALRQYFIIDLVSSKSQLLKNERYKRIRSALNSETTQAYLHFLVSVGDVFEHFLRLLQSEKTLIHLLYDEMCSLVKKLLFRFVNMDEFKNIDGEDVITIPFKDLTLKDSTLKYVDVGSKANEILMHIEGTKRKCFKLCAQHFYKTVTSNLTEKLPFKNQLLKSLQILHAIACKEDVNKTTAALKRIARMLSRCVQEEDIDKITDEWKVYVSDDEIKEEWYLESNNQENNSAEEACLEWKNIDVYWKKVLELNNSNQSCKKYTHLAPLIKAGLCLSHGQAPVERGFSVNKRMQKDRASMNISTIVGLRLIKDNIKEKLSETNITKEMIKFYHDAHSNYKEELELKAKQSKNDEATENSSRVKEPEKTPTDKLNKLKNSVDAAHKLIDEGNKHLETALKRKSFEDIAAAQALIAAGNKKLNYSKQ